MTEINQLFIFLKERKVNHLNDEWFFSEIDGILFRISKEERDDEIQVWDKRGFVATSSKDLQDTISLAMDGKKTSAKEVSVVDVKNTSAKEVSVVDVKNTSAKEVSVVDVKNTSTKEVSVVDVKKTSAKEVSVVDVKKTSTKEVSVVDVKKTSVQEEDNEEANPYTLVSSRKKKNSENGKMKDLGGGSESKSFVRDPKSAIKRPKDPFRTFPVKKESEEEKENRIKRNEEQWHRTIDKLNENWEYLRQYLRKIGSSTTLYASKISKNPMYSTISEESIKFWRNYGTIHPVEEFLKDFYPENIEISVDSTSGDITFTRKQF